MTRVARTCLAALVLGGCAPRATWPWRFSGDVGDVSYSHCSAWCDADGPCHVWGHGPECSAPDAAAATPSDPLFAELAVGSRHACGRTDDGSVLCWGDDTSGQIGSEVPGACVVREVPGAAGGSRVLAEGEASCVVAADGQLTCWGAVSLSGSGINSPRPIAHVAVGDLAHLVLTLNATLVCGTSGPTEMTCRWARTPSAALHDRTFRTFRTTHAIEELFRGAGRVCARGGGELTCWPVGVSFSSGEDEVRVAYDDADTPIDLSCRASWLCLTSGSNVRCRETPAWSGSARELVFEPLPFEPARLVCRYDGAPLCAASAAGEVRCANETTLGWEPVDALSGIDAGTLAGDGDLLCGLRDRHPVCVALDR